MLMEAYQNREALEEKIAEGRRNRKEAGNKYGQYSKVSLSRQLDYSHRFLIYYSFSPPRDDALYIDRFASPRLIGPCW